MVRRLTHIPDCEVRFPLGILILGIIFKFIYFLSYDHIVSCLFNFDA